MSRDANRPIAVHEIINLSNKTALFTFFFLVSHHEYLNSFDVNKVSGDAKFDGVEACEMGITIPILQAFLGIILLIFYKS